MYKVYCDNYLLYHSKLENLKICNPSLELELNKTGSFDFTIYQDHPYYSFIKKLKSIIRVYQDDYLLFRGRVLDDEVGWYNQKHITCEGELAFLLDSIQRPYDFTGGIAEFLGILISNHNAQVDEEKRFMLGNVTVTDPNDYIVRSDIDYVTTWDVITKKLIELLGGYIIVRHEDGVNYLDYLAEINVLSPQKITFGKNLLDLKRIRKGADIATVVIPLGAKLKNEEEQDTDKRLTIESVNGGVDFVQDSEAVAQYGIIVKTAIFDDVTDAENLKAKGQAQLADSVNQWESVELTAADMATVDKDVLSFHLGTQVEVISDPHGLNQRFLVSKLSLKLLDPAANKLVLGKTIAAFSDAIKGVSDAQGLILQEVNKTAQTASEAVYNVEQNLLASIQTSEENIKSTVAESYYLKEDTDALISSVSTEIEQTKNSVEIQFTQFSQDIEAVVNGTDAEFEEIRKYIRFVDGKILLGEVGNELELQIANDRISFLQDVAEVAYFSNRKLYVTDTQIMHSLQLGNFAFMPRANGNISFKKI
jgi:hypothetical protein